MTRVLGHWRRLLSFVAIGATLALLPGCISLPLPWQRSATPQPPLRVAGGTRPVIVCLGDSLTAGDAVPPDQSYPSWLQRRLDAHGYRYWVANAGVSGNRVADGLARLQRDVLDLHPAVVIVELGSNDPGHTAPGAWRQGLSTIVARVQAAGARVVLGGLDEPGMGDVYRAIAARYHVPLVWFTSGLWSRPGLWGDAHHPNGSGYHVVADTF